METKQNKTKNPFRSLLTNGFLGIIKEGHLIDDAT